MLDKLDGAEVRYYIKGRWIGTKKDLEKVFSANTRTITRYITRGMPEHEQSTKQLKIFDIEECIEWHGRNINKEQAKKVKKNSDNEIDKDEEKYSDEESAIIWDSLSAKQKREVTEASAYLRKTVSDANNAEEVYLTNQMKRKNLAGNLVLADDLDRSMAEQAVMHKTDKTNDEKVLPLILANRTQTEIKTILNSHNQKRLKLLGGIVSKEFNTKETLYDVIEIVLQKLNENNNPKKIKEKINEL